MRGVITTRHIFFNAKTIIAEFGLAAYARCLMACLANRRMTFLQCVARLSEPQPYQPQANLTPLPR